MNNAEYKHYIDARHKWMICPVPAKKGRYFDKEITINSPMWQKEACVQIRRYLAMDNDYGMSWDTSDGGWNNVIAIPFIKTNFSMDGGNGREVMIGCAAFEQRHDKSSLEFIWIHPFFRNTGLVKDSYKNWLDRFGEFHISHPISHAMLGIIRQQGTDKQKKQANAY